MTQLEQGESADCQMQFQQGVRTFALLFTRWMDTNGWSHPTMVTLAKACLDGASWFHSSQISGLRRGKLLSPGPRIFYSIERLNYYIYRYSTEKRLLPNTSSSNLYSEAYAITENGESPSVGWWVEVFCGTRIPADYDFQQSYFTDAQATEISQRWGALFRKLVRDRDLDLILELDRILYSSYPAKDADRLLSIRAVIENRGTWSSTELVNELPALTALTADLGGPTTEDALLDWLKR